MSTTSVSRGARFASKTVRQRQLIEATIATIADNGVVGTTTHAVTKAAGLSAGIVSLHFGSKNNLLKETLRFVAEEHRAVWSDRLAHAGARPEDQLWALCEAHFHPTVCNRERIAVWYAFFGEKRYRDQYREFAREFDDERADVVEALCRKLIASGKYAHLAPLSVTKMLESLADGLWLSILLYPDWMSASSARKEFHATLARTFPNHFPVDGPPPESWETAP